MDFLFRQRQRRIFSQMFLFSLSLWGIKFTDHFPSVVNGVKFPIKTGATCLPWVASRMLEKGILVVEGSPGISSFATHYFGPGFR